MLGNLYFERLSHQVKTPLHAIVTTSPRKVLFSLNFLLCICSICIAAFSLFLTQLLYDEMFTTGWVNWLGMLIVGIFLAIVAIIGMRGAHLVSLDLLLSYFWGIIIFIVPLLLGLFASFNFYSYFRIWIKHQWSQPAFLPLRELFCLPKDTANGKCIAPIVDTVPQYSQQIQEQIVYTMTEYLVDNTTDDYYPPVEQFNVTTWCLVNFNATDCEKIRNKAIGEAVHWGRVIITAQSVIGLTEVAIIAFAIYISYKILTSPVITQSMLDIINYLLLFPIAGCVGLAAYFWWISRLEISNNWVPKLYLALAVVQLFALPLGILSGRLKSRWLLAVYITVIVLILTGLGVAAAFGWILAKEITVDYRPSQEEIENIACSKHLPGCSGCIYDKDLPDNYVQKCPEWKKSEVIAILSLDLRLAGAVSTLSMLYLFGALIVAFLVQNNLKNYQTDFI